MPILIDGHNLIPKVPGLSLRAVDDEMQLVEMLQEYCRRARKKVEVFFDNAPPGQPRAHNFGSVTARFVREGSTADQAIRKKLMRLGREARNWTVVSSDHEVQAAARAARAAILSSEVFAQELVAALQSPQAGLETGEQPLSPEEIEDWLKLFGSENDKEN